MRGNERGAARQMPSRNQEKRATLLKVGAIAGILLLIAIDSYARAGGASSSGGNASGFRIIGYVVSVVLAAVTGIALGIALSRKIKKSRAIVFASTANDKFWHLGQMEDHARKTFLQMQNAWKRRNMEEVKGIITERLYSDYHRKLELLKKRKEMNILNSIEVKNVNIIGAEDYKDDAKDRFVAYIDGEMQDYIINEYTGELLHGTKKDVEPFSDTYHFVRRDNKWLLDYIDNHVTVLDVMMMKNKREV